MTSEPKSTSRSRRWQFMTTITSIMLGAAIAVTGSGAQPVAASATTRAASLGAKAAERTQGASGARARAFWPHRFTVTGSLSGIRAAVADEGGSVGSTTGDAVSITLDYSSDAELQQIQARFASRGMVLHRVRRYTIDAYRPQLDGSRESYWYYQWSLYGPSMRGTYNVSAGIDMMNSWKTSKGAGAVVAVLDTGILTGHPDFATTRFVPGYDFVCYADLADCRDNDATLGSDADPSDPGDWCYDEETGEDSTSSWHGTHVTGTIAAQLNRVGVAGIAPDAKILPVRVLGQCGGSDADINAAIRWAAGLPVAAGVNGIQVPLNANPADVINLSLGGWGACEPTTAAAIRAARAAGTVVVVSAGNSNDDARNYSPAGCREAFTVSATGPDGYPSSYTNVGPTVDIAAPGGDSDYAPDDSDESGLAGYPGCPYGEAKLGYYFEHPLWVGVASVRCHNWRDYGVPGGILSTLGADSYDFEGGYSYDFYEGTSMAAPHVTAVAALVAAKYPTMTPAKIEAALQLGARPLPTRSSDFEDVGAGTTYLEDYVLGYADYCEEYLLDAYGLVVDCPELVSSNADWTAFLEEYWYGETPGFIASYYGCSETNAQGVMGNIVYGTDPCAGGGSGSAWGGIGWWQLWGYAFTNQHDGVGWNWDPFEGGLYNPYSVSDGDDCAELGCGAGGLNATGALARARLLSRLR